MLIMCLFFYKSIHGGIFMVCRDKGKVLMRKSLHQGESDKNYSGQINGRTRTFVCLFNMVVKYKANCHTFLFSDSPAAMSDHYTSVKPNSRVPSHTCIDETSTSNYKDSSKTGKNVFFFGAAVYFAPSCQAQMFLPLCFWSGDPLCHSELMHVLVQRLTSLEETVRSQAEEMENKVSTQTHVQTLEDICQTFIMIYLSPWRERRFHCWSRSCRLSMNLVCMNSCTSQSLMCLDS